MRGGAVWRRTQPPMHASMHACMRAFGCKERLGALIHTHHFYLPRESSQRASSGGQIHRDAQVVKRRRGWRWWGWGWGGGDTLVISCSTSLLLCAEDTASPKSPSFCSRCTKLCARRAVMSLFHAERRSSCACGFAEVDILSLFKRALQAADPAGRLECQAPSSSHTYFNSS